MATDISMCSNALLRIGANEINSFSDAGAGAKIASNIYNTVYENEITSHRWRFAVGKTSLSRLTAVPENEWQYAFQLPADCLMVVGAYPSAHYEIYQDKIYANQTEIEIDYVFKPEETNLPPYFVKLLEFRLASEFALSVTHNRSLAETYSMEADQQFLVAAHADSNGRPNIAIRHSPFTDFR